MPAFTRENSSLSQRFQGALYTPFVYGGTKPRPSAQFRSGATGRHCPRSHSAGKLNGQFFKADMSLVGRCVRRQISFNGCDQLWNADRLGEKLMSLNLQAGSCLSFRHESCQKDNRYSVQRRIGLNSGGDFAAIDFRHRDIKKDKIELNPLRCLVGPNWLVLFPNGVAPRPLQTEFGR